MHRNPEIRRGACSFAVTVLLLFVGCTGASKPSSWTTATGAEQHERLLWKAIQDKDWASVEGHLSPTFIGVSADGKSFDRAGWIQLWTSVAIQQFSLGEVQVQPEGPDMKLTYILHWQAAGPNPVSSTTAFRVVSIWQQVKAGWMLSASSITPIQNN